MAFIVSWGTPLPTSYIPAKFTCHTMGSQHMLVRLEAHDRVVLGHLRKGIALRCRLGEQLGRCRVAAQKEEGEVAVSEAGAGRGSSGV